MKCIRYKVLLLIMNQSIICPISLEPIHKYGITAIGSIYEYNEIKKWLKINITDPVTNSVLPNNHVTIFDQKNGESVTEYAKRIRSNNLQCNNKFRLEYESPIKHNKLIEIKENIGSIDKKIWDKYGEMKRNRLLTMEGSEAYCTSDFNADDNDTIKRPDGTGKRFQFINLSNLQVNKGQYKSDDFSFADMSNSTFNKCDFSRCRFIGTNLEGTIFNECLFKGEEITFHKAIGSVIFINCSVEYTNVWVMTNDADNIKKILKNRLMTCELEVI